LARDSSASCASPSRPLIEGRIGESGAEFCYAAPNELTRAFLFLRQPSGPSHSAHPWWFETHFRTPNHHVSGVADGGRRAEIIADTVRTYAGNHLRGCIGVGEEQRRNLL
jgi:hypothetical protein